VAWGTFQWSGFSVTRGSLAVHRSSERVERSFCAICGTALTYRHGARPDHIDVTLVSLDDPALTAPEAHIWTSHKLPWVTLNDGLPQFPEWKSTPS
jgi:hypothetical protein